MPTTEVASKICIRSVEIWCWAPLRSGLTRLFIGSTAEDVLDKLPCDALIVKPSDFAERDTF